MPCTAVLCTCNPSDKDNCPFNEPYELTPKIGEAEKLTKAQIKAIREKIKKNRGNNQSST